MPDDTSPYRATYTRSAVERFREFPTAGQALAFLLDGVESDVLAPVTVTDDIGRVVFDEATVWQLAARINPS